MRDLSLEKNDVSAGKKRYSTEMSEDDGGSEMSDGSNSDSEDDLPKKKRARKKDNREWTFIVQFNKNDHEPEDIQHLVFSECKKLMEVTILFRLTTASTKANDIFLWKHSNFWSTAKGVMQFQMLVCPMKRRFGCECQLKICRTDAYVSIEMRGTHDAESHAPEKDRSKFLKVAQIEAIRSGVRVAPKQSAKHLRRNLEHSSPNSRIDPELLSSVRRKVRKFRHELTMDSLKSGALDDSYGHLERLVEQRWFPTLLDVHNNPDAEFHFDMFDVFIIGKDLNPADDIVYMNMTSLWHICNWLRAIASG